MIPLTRLKKDVQFNGELTKVVDVLKGIAVARYYSLEKQMEQFDQFFTSCGQFLGAMDLEALHHPFTRPSSSGVAVLVVTSDAGFLGGLNTQVLNAGLKEGGSQAALFVVGERGAGAARDLRKEFVSFPGIQDHSRFALASAVRDHLVREVLSGRCGRVVVAYPKPVSFSVQRVVAEPLLPVTSWAEKGTRRGVSSQTLWESRPESILEYVAAQWMAQRLSLIFGLSRLAEMAARFIHLEGSFQELTRQGKKLKLNYFRSKHEVIDRSMREIFAAQLLYKMKEAHE